MNSPRKRLTLGPAVATLLFLPLFIVTARAQDSQQRDPAAPQKAKAELDLATQSMSHHDHADMGPHMQMSAMRPAAPGDAARAQEVIDAARRVLAPYRDYRLALNDGYKIFMPQVSQKMYHFTNWRYAVEAAFKFDPEHPTSLLYEKSAEGYKLIGAMYTAPARMDEAALDQRIPLSQAQWHLHVNLCAPPREQKMEAMGNSPQFGLGGSITTREECEQAGGRFSPHIFGWMVHLYPFEDTPEKIWSVERQKPMGDSTHEHHHHE